MDCQNDNGASKRYFSSSSSTSQYLSACNNNLSSSISSKRSASEGLAAAAANARYNRTSDVALLKPFKCQLLTASLSEANFAILSIPMQRERKKNLPDWPTLVQRVSLKSVHRMQYLMQVVMAAMASWSSDKAALTLNFSPSQIGFTRTNSSTCTTSMSRKVQIIQLHADS